jgi:hypothetical protein
MNPKSITEIIFSKEELLTKKQLTDFLIGHNVEFFPDANNRGKFKATIRINGLDTIISSPPKKVLKEEVREMKSTSTFSTKKVVNVVE